MTPTELTAAQGQPRAARSPNGAPIRSGCGSTATSHEEFGVQSLFLVSRGERRPIAGFLVARGEGKLRRGACRRRCTAARRGPDRTIVQVSQESGGSRLALRTSWTLMTERAMLQASPCCPPTASAIVTIAADDYDVVRRAIAHIRGNWREQPEIEHDRRSRERHADRAASPVPPLGRADAEGLSAGAHARPCARGCCAIPRACSTPPTRSACPAPAGCTICS